MDHAKPPPLPDSIGLYADRLLGYGTKATSIEDHERSLKDAISEAQNLMGYSKFFRQKNLILFMKSVLLMSVTDIKGQND